jgi:hypothetical protein
MPQTRARLAIDLASARLPYVRSGNAKNKVRRRKINHVGSAAAGAGQAQGRRCLWQTLFEYQNFHETYI